MTAILSVTSSISKPRASRPRLAKRVVARPLARLVSRMPPGMASGLAIWAVVATLAGCATLPSGDDRQLLAGVPQTTLTEIEASAATGDAAAAAEAYLKLARESQPPARQALELRAAEAFYLAGQSQRALRTLGAIDSGRLSAGLRNQEHLIAARAALQTALPERVLSEVDRLGAHGLTNAQRIERLGLMAAAYRQNGDPVQAATQLDAIGRLLDDAQQRLDNQVSLLLTLSVLDASRLRELGRQGSGRLRAWAGLAELLAGNDKADAALLGRYRAWRSRHGGLPASDELPRAYYAALAGDYATGADAWVLLPRSGRYSGAGTAIASGLRHADANNAGGSRPGITTVDSANGADAAYERAISQGADLVIGPLQKQAVGALSRRQVAPVPTLALNRDKEGRALPGSLYQFALSPEDEAISAANHAWASGLRSALLLYPQGPWGSRMAGAFREHWSALGGTLAGDTLYGPTPASMTTGVETLLAPAKGDLIFLVATDGGVRHLWSALKAANARELPVLATSHVYDGAGTDSLALAGLYFVDIPWLIGASGPTRAMPRLSQGGAGANATIARLAAMGVDGYRLAPRSRVMSQHPGHFLPGVSGGLSIDGSGRVLRTLALARFEAAGAVAVARIEPARTSAPKEARGAMAGPLLVNR